MAVVAVENRGLVEPAPSADLKDGAPTHVQRSTQDDNPHRLHDQLCGCLWRDSSQNTVKRSRQIAAYELTILTLCCACSLRMYQFALGDGRQKQMYDYLDILFSGNARDKSSALPYHCHTLHRMPHECG